MKKPPCFDDSDAKKKIQEICGDNQIDLSLLIELCDVVHRFSGSGRAEGITAEISQAIDSFEERSQRSDKSKAGR